MPVIRVVSPSITKTTDTVAKMSAYGVVSRPDTEPRYPVTVTSLSGKGRYSILVVGDGDATATIHVYVDGAERPTDSVTSDTPAVIEGSFNSSLTIRIVGSGLHSTITYAVFTEATVLKDVTIS
ncbi:MAG: hypothetical protein QW680_11375 [Pyrobaculum sp.]